MGTVHSLDAQRRALDAQNRLRDRALEEAHALRAEAIDEFFRSTGAWLGHTLSLTQRAADRLAARLRQHAKRRAAAGGSRAFEA